MKTILTALIALAATLCAHSRPAILVAHYGSSDDTTRALTIDRITADIRAAFPAAEVREAYISPVVRRALTRRGISVPSPAEALIQLRAQGYDTVYVQPTTIIDGAEMAQVRSAVEAVRPFFSCVRLGRSLCYSPDDCREVAGVLLSESAEKDEAIVYVGHGNMLPSTATYAQLDLMLRAGSDGSFMMSTIEGYPDADVTVEMLRRLGTRISRVRLVPFLLVCGNHTRRDIAGSFAQALREAGFPAEVTMRGLAENAPIRAIYVERMRELIASAE